MPINTIYRSTTGIMGRNIRYYIEIIPRSTTLYSTPTTESFPLAALDNDWDIESVLNDERLGLKRPDGYKVNIDLEMLSEDLRDYLLNPFISHDMTTDFPYKAPTRQEIPNFDLTNVWIIKTDEGDDAVAEDDFVIYNTFGVKKNPSRIHQITKAGDIQKHKLDIVLHDLFRVITEAIHPIFLTWCAIDDVVNNTRTTPKEVSRVYDIVYLTQAAKSDYYNVKVRYASGIYTFPTSTTVDGVSLSLGDKILFHHTSSDFAYILELVSSSPVEYERIREAGPFGDISNGEIFYVQSGTSSDKNYSVLTTVHKLGIGLRPAYVVNEVTVETGADRVIAKIDGNFNSAIGYYVKIRYLHEYMEYAFNYFYRKLMRTTSTSYKLLRFGNNTMLVAYKFYEQSYDSKYTIGDELSSYSDLYFCALVETNGVLVSGYMAENDNNEGIYEYENVWDLLENIKGHAVTISYGHNDKEITMSFDPIIGFIDTLSVFEVEVEELIFGDDSSYEIEENTESKRGVVVNINVPGDDKNEHKYIKAGSISDDELSVKAMFHTNPSVNLVIDGWIDTNSYPELISSLDKTIRKQNNPERPFDIAKLVYFDTPSSIADSELAIRPHSACSIVLNGITTDYLDIPFSDLSTSLDPWDELKLAFIDLQRYSGMPYATAKHLAEYFSKEGRFLLKTGILADTIYNIPVGRLVINDMSSKLLNGGEPAVSQYWILRSKRIKGDNQEAEIELIGLY